MKGLCILAGSGDLPVRLYERAVLLGFEVKILALKGAFDKKNVAHHLQDKITWTSMGSVVGAVRLMKSQGFDKIVMAGGMRRPSLASLTSWDKETFHFAKKILGRGKGDDHLLRLVISYLEEDGFEVLGLNDIMGESLTLPLDFSCGGALDKECAADIEYGREIALQLYEADIGQALVVQQGMILGIEAIEGTDGLIKRCAPLQREGRGGILLKYKKKHQDERVDLPVVGVRTLHNCHRAAMRGIALEAGSVLVLDQKELCEAAAQTGLFITTFASLS